MNEQLPEPFEEIRRLWREHDLPKLLAGETPPPYRQRALSTRDELIGRLRASGTPALVIASRFGISPSRVWDIAKQQRRRWSVEDEG